MKMINKFYTSCLFPMISELGDKDQNSSTHLHEAFTELYAVWQSAIVRERLYEMLLLTRDTMIGTKGYLTLFFQPDWKPVSIRDSSDAYIMAHHGLDYVSLAHNVETSYLLLEASYALRLKNNSLTVFISPQAHKESDQHPISNLCIEITPRLPRSQSALECETA